MFTQHNLAHYKSLRRLFHLAVITIFTLCILECIPGCILEIISPSSGRRTSTLFMMTMTSRKGYFKYSPRKTDKWQKAKRYKSNRYQVKILPSISTGSLVVALSKIPLIFSLLQSNPGRISDIDNLYLIALSNESPHKPFKRKYIQ